MIKVEDININIKKETRNESKRHYTISVIPKGKGFQARVTLKIIGGGKNPRLSKYSSKSASDAVCKVLNRMSNELMPLVENNILDNNICLKIYDSVMFSIQQLHFTNDINVMKAATELFHILSRQNKNTTVEHTNNTIQRAGQPVIESSYQATPVNIQNNNVSDFFEKNKLKPITSKKFKEVAEEWFEYEKSLTKISANNPKPLSPKTVEGYYTPLKYLLSHFKKNSEISKIKEEALNDCIDEIASFRSKEITYVVLKLIFDFAREKNYVFYVPNIKKPVEPYSDEEEELIFIESNRQELWVELFEKENTDVSMLFETMLYTGIRPEEACGLKWCAIKEDSNIIKIENAFKDIPIYNGTKVIGHKREDGRLKTPESYRSIPLNPRLKQKLLEHKEKQKELFKILRKKWNENCYVFLSRRREPYVSNSLNKPIKNFIDKYELEYMTPYGLRHSFATYCSEQGMDPVVLMRLMGHSNFNTTQKYYICVSNRRKQEAIKEVYKNTFQVEKTA